MLNEQGTITHFIGMHRDITQSYESEKKLINQKLLIESVINSSPIAMVVIDDQDKVIFGACLSGSSILPSVESEATDRSLPPERPLHLHQPNWMA